MRAALAAAALLALAGCGGGAAAGGVDRCAERLLTNVAEGERDAAALGSARRTCELLDRNGLVYEDGALRIEAAEGSCEAAEAGSDDPPAAVPCENADDPVLDCALLRHVRRDEVQAYLAGRRGARCDDGTPLDELGVQAPAPRY